jgi:hypothetical protein
MKRPPIEGGAALGRGQRGLMRAKILASGYSFQVK